MDREAPPLLNQINLVVRNLDASIAFYRRLGLDVRPATERGWASHHASAPLPNGMLLELDTIASCHLWHPRGRHEPGSGNVLFFAVPSRPAVDEIFTAMTAAGCRGPQEPEDGFWGARYAILEDPDGNPVGIMSPVDPALRKAPPLPPDSGEAG